MKDAMNVSEIATAKALCKSGVSAKMISKHLGVEEACVKRFLPKKKKRKTKAKK